MSSHHQSHAASAPASGYPEGRVEGPSLLYGGVGLALAATMQVAGLFKRVDARLEKALLDSVFHGVAPDVLSIPVLVIISAVFCFGLAYAVLDSAGIWRRVILGMTALVIILAMVPTFAVWNIYFSPFLPAIALFWAWFCAMMYVNHHVMPCEVLNSPDARCPDVKCGVFDGVSDKLQTPPTQGAPTQGAGSMTGSTTNTNVSDAAQPAVAASQLVKEKVVSDVEQELEEQVVDPDAKYKPKATKQTKRKKRRRKKK